jgi:CRISPR-associated protein Cas1
MIKKVVEVSQAGTFLSVKLGQLVVRRDGQTVGQVPCEDIGVLLVDHTGVTYTHSVLTTLLEQGAAVVICNGQHHPAGMLMPLEGNCVQTERYRQQLLVKEPIKKRLWQQIIQSKIKHQAKIVCEDEKTSGYLRGLAKQVRSGDPDNIEAQAARRFWRAYLQGLEFRRQRDGVWPNAFLNYGYTVMRAAVARALCSTGLLPALGIHHSNKYNAFCLADDVVEPFRGFVEAKVRTLCRERRPEESLSQTVKAVLLETLYETVEIGGYSGPLMVGLHRTAASLVRCFAGEDKQLELPQI